MGIPFYSVKSIIDKEGSGGGGGTASKSSEIKLVSSSLESVSGTATTQEGANGEIVSAIKKALTVYNENTTYNLNDYVFYSGKVWQSLQANNKGNAPAEDSAFWKEETVSSFSATIKKEDATGDYTFANLLNSAIAHVVFYVGGERVGISYKISATEITVHFSDGFKADADITAYAERF